MVRKFLSELIGTMFLVFFGCGTAVAVNQYVTSVYGVALPFTMILIALAFGLALVALVYMFGKISGCHVNPAVSIACLIDGRMSVFECVYYIGAQLLGGIAGAGLLSWIFQSTTSLGANGFETLSALSTITTAQVAFVLEAILTFVFVLVVLSVTKKESCNSGLVIGLTLTLVHIMGIPFTGTSVNPARSLGPAIFTKGLATEQLWVFLLAPMVGAVLAALFYRFVLDPKEKTLAYVSEVEEEYEDEDTEEEPNVEEKKTTKKSNKKNK